MIATGSLVIGIAMMIVFASWLVRRVRGRRGQSTSEYESWERHRDAQNRAPPVDLGEVREAGVVDFSRHHSGERHAVCKVEGFVVFVEDVPDDVDVADVLRFKVLSYNRGHTSATATFLERVR